MSVHSAGMYTSWGMCICYNKSGGKPPKKQKFRVCYKMKVSYSLPLTATMSKIFLLRCTLNAKTESPHITYDAHTHTETNTQSNKKFIVEIIYCNSIIYFVLNMSFFINCVTVQFIFNIQRQFMTNTSKGIVQLQTSRSNEIQHFTIIIITFQCRL